MTNPETRIAIGVVIDENKVLVIERLQREIGRNGKPIVWAFPAGKIEEDETPMEAAVREIAEETGYRVEAIEHIDEGSHPQYPVYAYYIGCRLVDKVADLSEIPATIVAHDWVPIANINELFTWPVNEKVQYYIQRAI